MFSKWFPRRAKQARLTLQDSCNEETAGLITGEEQRLVGVKKAFSQYWKPLAASVVLVLLTSLTTLWLPNRQRPPFDTSGYLCAPNGVPVSVAHARGCEFDWMSFHWLPRGRFDAENLALIQEFEAIRPWQRFADAAGTQLLSRDDMMAGTSAFLTRREHLHHCQYSVRQAYVFMARGDDPPFNYAHIVHCTDALIEAIYENTPENMDDLVIQAVPFPKHPEVVS
ncbi:hypothetical protein L13192_04095 [Pyrenophora tritici-repentis]|nr:hypothetical protein L13192_04095 [Pyrenophora tritici-repentis]